MASASRRAKFAAVLVAIAVAALCVIPVALGAFGGRTQNEGDIVTAVPDFTPPAITATVAAKSLGGVTGYVRKGGGYYVYANVSPDTGNPASGISTVKANAAELTSGQTEAAMVSGTYTAGGTSYNYRSAELTATATVEGSKAYSVTASDVAGNSKSVAGTATVDNTVPTASNIGTTNVGTAGLAEQGDSVVFTFSEPIDPQSVLSGWTGAETNVTVRITHGSILSPTKNDVLQIYDSGNTTTLPLGVVDLGRSDYSLGILGGYYRFVNSKMSLSGNTIKVVLGTYTIGVLEPARETAAGTGTMIWTPVATPYDRAGNVMSTAAATQSPAPTKAF
jgi:hypothetical protein